MGHKLFKSTPESFPVPFIQADVFALPALPLPAAPPPDPLPAPPTSLAPLAGRLSAIHMSYFFHLFAEERQAEIARRVAPLLARRAGAMVFGAHVGRHEKGFSGEQNTHGIPMFCHSPESWRELWEGVFPAGCVRVDAHLEKFSTADHPEGKHEGYMLVWCVTRV